MTFAQNNPPQDKDKNHFQNEVPRDKYLPNQFNNKNITPAMKYELPGIFTTQVNVDSLGHNIVGDAANEPTIAIDPLNSNNMVIGWRQFDNVNSNFRQAGYAYTTDRGLTWTFPGKIDPGIFRSDPVLSYDTSGNFYYNSLTTDGTNYTCKVYKSTDGGVIWDTGTNAHGGDKQWMTIDRTNGIGSGNIYAFWTSYYSSCPPGFFTRSTNHDSSYEDCTIVDGYPYWGTMAVGNYGELYIAGTFDPNNYFEVTKSTNANIPASVISWDSPVTVDLDGVIGNDPEINPVGILGQVNIDIDRSTGPGRGNVYVLASVMRSSNGDPGDVMFAKSTDGGLTWSPPVRINDDTSTTNTQWFGVMSVAPNGRIDVAWLDTRDAPLHTDNSDLYYSYSIDQGNTWSVNARLSDTFDPHVGYPQQDKIGDYIGMISDNTGANLAWANTLNNEEDVYYSYINPMLTGVANQKKDNYYALSCYPNPFHTKTVIRYQVPDDNFVRLDICDLYGQVLTTLINKKHSAGIYNITFSGDMLTAGFYFCRMTAGDHVQTARMIRIE